MDITVDRQAACVIAQVAGRLDGTNMQAADNTFKSLIEEGARCLLLDLTPLDYISSAGLRVLLSAAKKMKAAGGSIILFGLNSNVQEVFRLSGFSKIFPIYQTREEALQHAGAKGDRSGE